MGRQSGTRFLYKAGFEVHEIKGITDLQDPVKLFLWHDFSVRAPALARASAGKPWLGDGGKCIGMYVTEKGAIGRIGYRRLIAAQMRGNSVGYDGVAGNVTAWFRAIAHQSRCVGQKNRTPRMTGCSRVCIMALPYICPLQNLHDSTRRAATGQARKLGWVIALCASAPMHQTDSCSSPQAADRSWEQDP